MTEKKEVSVSVIKATIVVCTVVVLSACAAPGVPQSEQNFNQRIYLGGGVLASQLEPEADDVEETLDEDISGGGSLLLGFDLTNRFSIEGHVADLGEANFSPSGSIDYQVAGLSALVYGLGNRQNRSRREGFSVFGRLGVGALENESDGLEFRQVNNAHVLVGAGLEYGFSNGLAARAELLAHEVDARYAQLALVYRFGSSGPQERAGDLPADSTSETVETDDVETAVVPLPETIEQSEADEQLEPAAVDIDVDGVDDKVDECPDSDPGELVDEVGCAVFGGAIDGISFLSGSAELTAEATEVLSDISGILLQNPDVRIVIQAHTDNSGRAEDNLQLSKRRALAVARFFVDAGVPGSRLRPQAFGESEPRQSNQTPAGRAANRRVEIDVIK